MANFLVSLCVIIFRSYSFSLLTTKLRWNFLECQCSRIDAFGGEALRWIYLVKYLKSLRIIDLWLPLKKIFHTLACFIAISTRMISCYFLECAIFGFFVTDELVNVELLWSISVFIICIYCSLFVCSPWFQSGWE